MALLETEDSKNQLLKKSAHHREELEGEVKAISQRTEKMITNVLIIGGALAATYFLVKQFSGSKSRKAGKSRKIKLVTGQADDETEVAAAEPHAPGIVSQIGTALASQATILLLNLAKEKLGEFLEAQAQKKIKKDEHS